MKETFEKIYNNFEKTKNICEFYNKYEKNMTSTRFLLIRSLDKENLKEVIKLYSNFDNTGNLKTLTEKTYNSPVTIDQLLNYIENKRKELIKKRESELEGLSEILDNFPIVNCGVRNDKVDDIVKTFVRNKSLKTILEIETELNKEILPRIKQYSLWSYYNQTSNDIIELFFLKHPSVIPTIRKIPNVDFFIKIEGNIIPFDLKFTHISDSYFDLASQGIIRNNNNTIYDDFYIDENSDTNELKKIKSYYNTFKRNHKSLKLPNMSGLKKNDLIELLTDTNVQEALTFVENILSQHSDYIPTTTDELYALEWWNYKYQGERLFCNNNRLFVFLAYKNKLIDGRELKGRTTEIGNKIKKLLDNLTMNDIHTIHYHYDKDMSLIGDYTALSLSTIYYE